MFIFIIRERFKAYKRGKHMERHPVYKIHNIYYNIPTNTYSKGECARFWHFQYLLTAADQSILRTRVIIPVGKCV